MADLGKLRKNVGGGRRKIRTTVVTGDAVLLVLSPQYSLRPSRVMRHVAGVASVLGDRPVTADVRLIGCFIGGRIVNTVAPSCQVVGLPRDHAIRIVAVETHLAT